MYPNQEVGRKHIVVNSPGERRETITETTSVTQEKGGLLDDTTIQDAATKKLTADPNLASISVIVIDGRVTLNGKAKAERVVKAVRGVKLVENKIEVSN